METLRFSTVRLKREKKKRKEAQFLFFFSRWAAVEFSITYFPRSPSDLHPHRGCSRMGAAWGAAQLLPHTVRLWGQSWDNKSPPRPPLIFITEPHRRITRSPPTPPNHTPTPPQLDPDRNVIPLPVPTSGGDTNAVPTGPPPLNAAAAPYE